MEGCEIKMKKILENNLALKVLSFLISVTLWIYVAVVVNPDREITIKDVPISYSGHQSLLEQNYMITLQSPERVNLKIKGPINIISQVSKENVSAYVDLSGYTTEGTYSLPVKVRLPFEQISVSDKTVYNANIVISKVYAHEFDVEVMYTGTLKEDYMLESDKTATGIKAKVSGPDEIVKSIDKAVIMVDLNGVKSDFTVTGEIKLLNSNGDVIDKHDLTVTPSEGEVTCTLLKKKTVPVTIDFDEEGYTAEISGDKNITIIGKEDDIDKISSVSTEKVQSNGTEEEITVETKPILPSGIKTEQQNVKISVKINKNETAD